MSQMQTSTGRASGRWAALAAGGLAVALHAITLGGTYVYDDKDVVRDDPRVRETGHWLQLLKGPYLPGAPDPLYRPVTSLSFAAQWRVHGDRPWAFHLVNVLLHAGASALVAMLAARMMRRRGGGEPRRHGGTEAQLSCAGEPAGDGTPSDGKSGIAAWVGGLLFAAHPVHVEAVAYLVGRAETLCAIGVLGGLVLFHSPKMSLGRACAIAGCFWLAVLSKENGLLLAPMLLAVYLVRRFVSRDLDDSAPQRRNRQLLLVLLCFSICGYVFWRESLMSFVWDPYHMRWSVNPIIRSRGLDRALLPIGLVGRYLALLVFPLRLSVDYGAAVTDCRMDWHDPYWYIGAAAILGWCVAMVMALRRRSGFVLTSLLCLALAYGMISNTMYLIGTVMGERLIYLGSAFFVLLVAAALIRLPRKVAWGVSLVVLALASAQTVNYAWRWNDALRLYGYCRQSQPRSVYLHVLQADELMSRGRLAEAEPLLKRARELGPDVWSAWKWSAMLAEKENRRAEADAYAKHAFDLLIDPPQSRVNRPARRPSTQKSSGGSFR